MASSTDPIRETASYVGRLSDGKSAASQDVQVRLGDLGLEIVRDGVLITTWPYNTLSASEPLRRHAVDALLSTGAAPGAVLFVTGPTFARALPSHAPHLSAAAWRWRAARPWLGIAAALVGAFLLMSYFNVSPARMIASLIPDSARAEMGKNVLSSMVGERRVCSTAKGDDALNALAKRLVPDARFKIIVVDWSVMNAFAVPGEQIVIARGILDHAESPDEVAGVLAHEMGHGLERHPETSLVRAIGLAAGAELVLGGSGGGLAGLGVLLAQLSYSRGAEHEADIKGLELMRKSQVSPKSLATFFDRMAKVNGEADEKAGASRLTMFRSHPLTAERRKLVESQAPYEATPALSPRDWRALKSICNQEPVLKDRNSET